MATPRWYKQRAADLPDREKQLRELRGWDPEEYIRHGVLWGILGGIVGGGVYSSNPEFGFLLLVIAGFVSTTFWLIGVVGKGVQVGRRWE